MCIEEIISENIEAVGEVSEKRNKASKGCKIQVTAGETEAPAVYNTPQNHPVEDDRWDIYPSTPMLKGCSEGLTSLVLPGYTKA